MIELERSVIIAESWAQRSVLEPVRNAERLAEYEAVKSLWRCEPDSKIANRCAPCVIAESNVTVLNARERRKP